LNLSQKQTNYETFLVFSRLIGHSSKTPSFALDWAKNNYRVGSGGKDTNVLIWDVEDY